VIWVRSIKTKTINIAVIIYLLLNTAATYISMAARFVSRLIQDNWRYFLSRRHWSRHGSSLFRICSHGIRTVQMRVLKNQLITPTL
jgi:hypothetical protein